ncbi:MAG: RagB/SusD family nutrient uptake outer membrane protein [Prevotellaceae bacterium]|jgi:hypothetical protein|nr:RagB/SusD family nutrient uptake outer membrane protein [Prevotellaceae bacterium]
MFKKLRFVFLLALMPACMEVLNENDVDTDRHYNNFNDADNAILGIYGKLMGLADRVIILNELRADLLDITPNATNDMAAISNHTAAADNKYCDVAPFYEVILNCNDALKNFDGMRQENKLSPADYAYRYADVATVRCWVYLQLAIHFGSVPYITDPLQTVSDLQDMAKFPLKSLDDMVVTLISCMESLPTTELSTESPLYQVSDADGYDMRMLFLNKKVMLGDLYLWADRYGDAARLYYDVIDEAEKKLFSGSEQFAYKLDGDVWDASHEPRFQICYPRYKSLDISSFRNRWKEMFARPSSNSELRREMITMWSYNARFAPQYPLIELFANTGKGKYQLKPTDWAIDSLWEAQVQRDNNFVFDGRGREASFDRVNGQPVAIKYLYDYYPQETDENRTIHLMYNDVQNEFVQQGRWFVYRAGLLHLRYAEAVNRCGYVDLAHSLLNIGVHEYYDWTMDDGSSKRNNKGGVQYSGYRPLSDTLDSEKYPYPFFLDGRLTTSSQQYYYSSPWGTNYGIRRRAWVRDVSIPALPAAIDSVRWLEEALIQEAALECGFEGHRWGDLLRVARRKNRENANGAAYISNLMGKAKGVSVTPETAFLPWKNNLATEN